MFFAILTSNIKDTLTLKINYNKFKLRFIIKKVNQRKENQF